MAMGHKEEQAYQQRIEDVKRLTRQGFKAPFIARSLGVSLRTVYRLRLLSGMAQKQRRMSVNDIRAVLEMYSNGSSQGAIARQIGFSHTAVHDLLVKRGLL